MDDVTLTLRAQDQASGALRAINAQLARMRQLTDATNRATAAATGRTARSADAEEARRYVRNQRRIIAEVQQRVDRENRARVSGAQRAEREAARADTIERQREVRNGQRLINEVRRRVDRENRERERGRRQAEREAERTARTQEREAARAARAQERAAERAARAAARAEALHRRQWSAQAFLSGMRGTQGASRIAAQFLGGGQTGMAGYGSLFGSIFNVLTNSVTQFWQVIGGVLWSTVTRVFNFLRNVVGDLIRRFTRLATVVGTAVVGAFSAIGYSAVNAASQIQQMSIGLDTLVGKGEKAKRFMQEMMEFARKTPFDFFQMMPDTRRLLGVGFSTEEVKSLMQSMGDAAAALGIGQAGITGLVKAFSDVRAKGYVQAQEITRQFAEWGVPALRFISEYLGVTTAVTLQLIQQRKITADIGIAAIQGGMARNFGGAMTRQFQTVSGQLNTLKETWAFTMAAIGESSLKPIEGIIAGISGMLNAFRTGGGAERVGRMIASWLTPERIHNFVQNVLRALTLLGRGINWLYVRVAGLMESIMSGDVYTNIANRIMAIGEYLEQVFRWAVSKIPVLLRAALLSMAGLTGRFLYAELAAAGVAVVQVVGTVLGAIAYAIGRVLDTAINGAIDAANMIPGVNIQQRSNVGGAAWDWFQGGIQEMWSRWASASVVNMQRGIAGVGETFGRETAGMTNDFPTMQRDWSRPQSAVWQQRAAGLAGWGRQHIGGALAGGIPPWLQGAGNQFETEMMKYLNTPLADINNNTAAALGLLGSIDDSLSPRGFGANKQTELLRNRLARTNLGGGGVRIHITGGNLRDQQVAEQAITQYVNQTNPFAAAPAGLYVGAQ